MFSDLDQLRDHWTRQGMEAFRRGLVQPHNREQLARQVPEGLPRMFWHLGVELARLLDRPRSRRRPRRHTAPGDPS